MRFVVSQEATIVDLPLYHYYPLSSTIIIFPPVPFSSLFVLPIIVIQSSILIVLSNALEFSCSAH